MLFGAFSAAGATMFFWALAAVVPVIIHFLSRRKVYQENWAAMQFLLAAMHRNARRLRMEQLILLLLRVATLVLFAVGLADVSCHQSLHTNQSSTHRFPIHTMLVLDVSYSMDYQRDGKTRFERAQEAAISLVDRGGNGDAYTVITLGDPAQAVIGSAVYDRDKVVREIHQLRTQQRGANLSNTLTRIQAVLDNVRTTYPRLTRENIYFLTDLGQSTWGAVTHRACQEEIQRIADRASLFLIDVGGVDAGNFALTDLRISSPSAHSGQVVELEADLRQFGGSDAEDHLIQWYVDDQWVFQEEVAVPAGKQISVGLEHRFETSGEHTVELRCDVDSLSVDNHRWLSVYLPKQVEVLCVRGKKNAARFVSFALQSGQPFSVNIRPQIVSELALLDGGLERFNCIFLCNVGRMGAEEASNLSDYVHGGGGLVIFLGDLVVAENYNRHLGGLENPQRLLPAEIGTIRSADNQGFDPHEYEHAIVQPFRGNEQAGLLSTPVWKYFQLSPYGINESSIAFSFVDGDPVIVTERLGHGRVVLVATSASTASVDQRGSTSVPWTGLVTWPSFPPLVHTILEFAMSGQHTQRNVEVGQPIQVVIPEACTEMLISVTTPDRQRRQLRSSRSQWTFSETFLSGIYCVQFGGPAAENHCFAANVHTAESSMARLARRELPAVFWDTDDHQDSQVHEMGEQHQSIFRWVLGGVFMLLLGETLLAWQFGKRRG